MTSTHGKKAVSVGEPSGMLLMTVVLTFSVIAIADDYTFNCWQDGWQRNTDDRDWVPISCVANCYPEVAVDGFSGWQIDHTRAATVSVVKTRFAS